MLPAFQQLVDELALHRRRRLFSSEEKETWSQLDHEKWKTKNGEQEWDPIGFLYAVYNYPGYAEPKFGDQGKNTAWGAQLIGFSNFAIFNLAGLTFSWPELLIIDFLAIAENEYRCRPGMLARRDRGEKGRMFFGLYEYEHTMGTGISGVNGWLAGYLGAKAFASNSNWLSGLGYQLLVGYLIAWYTDQHVHHEAHFVTMASGFVAGMFFNYFFKPRPALTTIVKWDKWILAAFVAFIYGGGAIYKAKYQIIDTIKMKKSK